MPARRSTKSSASAPSSSACASAKKSSAARFDRKIERDAAAGKLDRFAEQAVDDFRKGRAREL
jgi:hypothetical protein